MLSQGQIEAIKNTRPQTVQDHIILGLLDDLIKAKSLCTVSLVYIEDDKSENQYMKQAVIKGLKEFINGFDY